jgi:hypothetical protein
VRRRALFSFLMGAGRRRGTGMSDLRSTVVTYPATPKACQVYTSLFLVEFFDRICRYPLLVAVGSSYLGEEHISSDW